MLNRLIFILMMVLMFACIVIIHEWGHYIMAKKNGVLVHEFAVGMGPKLWEKQKGETLYTIRLLPIGGFCSMEEEVGASQNPKAMSSKKPWQKLLIVSAGAFMNFVLAWILTAVVMGYIGYGSNVIASVEPGMPAQAAGLQKGDKITAINGNKVKNLLDVSSQLSKEEKAYTLTVMSTSGETNNIVLSTKLQEDGVARFGFIGERVHYNILYNFKYGFISMCNMVKQIWSSLIGLITGSVGMDQLAGIAGVVNETSKQWDSGIATGGIGLAIMNIVSIAAVLSANLGIVNLLPFPALDGGRIVFIVIEMIRGKAISAEKEGAVHFVGMVLLMLLTVVVFYNDLVRIVQ